MFVCAWRNTKHIAIINKNCVIKITGGSTTIDLINKLNLNFDKIYC
jgi:hypothetical protein